MKKRKIKRGKPLSKKEIQILLARARKYSNETGEPFLQMGEIKLS